MAQDIWLTAHVASIGELESCREAVFCPTRMREMKSAMKSMLVRPIDFVTPRNRGCREG